MPAKRELGDQLITSGETVEGIQYLQEVASQGDPKACCLLADCYREGKGVNKSRQEFWRWMNKAANYGHHSANRSVEMLEDGAMDVFDL